MALAHQIDKWLDKGGHTTADMAFSLKKYRAEPVALPRRLLRTCGAKREAIRQAAMLPALLDITADEEMGEREAAALKNQVRETLTQAIGKDNAKLETYYALIMMDGDRMGAILSGDDKTSITYRDSFHPQVVKGFDEHAGRHEQIEKYGQQKRALSPNRHLAISGALNDFSLTVVRHVVEEEHLGRVIYAGGDDVLAMLPVADMLSAMQRLRQAYSGTGAEQVVDDLKMKFDNGFALLEEGKGDKRKVKLMRMMGRNATASCGAVIAHHQAPLAAVRRELEAAEKRAKNEGGRDAFSITVIKRSGGALRLTAKWGESLDLLNDLRGFLADSGVSRRAVYNTLEWLKEQELPTPEGDGVMLQVLLAYQLDRQTDKKADKAKSMVKGLAERLTKQTLEQKMDRIHWLRNFLSVAEFLARETRTGGDDE